MRTEEINDQLENHTKHFSGSLEEQAQGTPPQISAYNSLKIFIKIEGSHLSSFIDGPPKKYMSQLIKTSQQHTSHDIYRSKSLRLVEGLLLRRVTCYDQAGTQSVQLGSILIVRIIIYKRRSKMEFQSASLSNYPFYGYPYNFYPSNFLNSPLNCFQLGLTGNNDFSSSFNPTTFPVQHIFNSQRQDHQYSSKVAQTTILPKVSPKEEQTEFKPEFSRDENLRSKRRPSHMQKDNRNVASNLLRIFFKNIMEVRKYDALIEAVIRKSKIVTKVSDFLLWLERFKINYKNYIKPTDITKIMSIRHSQDNQKIFMILLRHYIKDIGLSHCATSKRIDHDNLKKHLKGLRVLSDLADIRKM